MLLRTFSQCSHHVKLQLSSSYCRSLYTCHLWYNYTVKQYRQIQVAHNNVLNDWWVIRNIVVRMVCLWRIEEITSLSCECVANSSAWRSSKLYANHNKCLYGSQIVSWCISCFIYCLYTVVQHFSLSCTECCSMWWSIVMIQKCYLMPF